MEKRVSHSGQVYATSLCDSRHVLITLCFAQAIISATLIAVFFTHLSLEERFFTLNSKMLLLSHLAAGGFTLLLVASLATVISVWVYFQPLLLASSIVVMIMLTVVTLALTEVVQLHCGAWDSLFADGYATNGDEMCPGIVDGFCCGWDRCPYPKCQFAHRPCNGVVTGWVHMFFLKASPMLSLMLALGMLQVGFAFYCLRQSWWG